MAAKSKRLTGYEDAGELAAKLGGKSARRLKTAKLCLYDLKEPNAFGDLCDKLDVSEAMRNKRFFCGEYADLELEVDAELNIVGGRFLPKGHR